MNTCTVYKCSLIIIIILFYTSGSKGSQRLKTKTKLLEWH